MKYFQISLRKTKKSTQFCGWRGQLAALPQPPGAQLRTAITQYSSFLDKSSEAEINISSILKD
jgi:hypothetical protein